MAKYSYFFLAWEWDENKTSFLNPKFIFLKIGSSGQLQLQRYQNKQGKKMLKSHH